MTKQQEIFGFIVVQLGLMWVKLEDLEDHRDHKVLKEHKVLKGS